MKSTKIFKALTSIFIASLIITGTLLVQAQQTDPNILLNPYGDGKVGIGTTTPAEKLDVTGNIKATGTICDTNGCIGSSSSGGGSSYSLDADDGDPTSVVYVNSAGKVGIGTQNAMEDLEVNGTLQTDEIKLDQKVSCGKLYTDVSGNVLCGDDQTGGVGVWSENLDDIYYNLGNVGIGTTPSPDIKLEVNGKVKASEINATGTVTIENTLDMTGQRILNLSEPIEDTDAVNKAYLDTLNKKGDNFAAVTTNKVSVWNHETENWTTADLMGNVIASDGNFAMTDGSNLASAWGPSTESWTSVDLGAGYGIEEILESDGNFCVRSVEFGDITKASAWNSRTETWTTITLENNNSNLLEESRIMMSNGDCILVVPKDNHGIDGILSHVSTWNHETETWTTLDFYGSDTVKKIITSEGELEISSW